MHPKRHLEDIEALADAINNQADIRLLVVLATGFIEQNLPSLCLSRLGLKGDAAEELFKKHFKRLDGRIDLALATGAIDSFVAKTLKYLSEIRNKVAHHPSVTTIDHPLVAPIFDRLEVHVITDPAHHVASTGSSRETGLRKIIAVLVSQLFDLAEEAWGGDMRVQLERECR